MPTAQQEKTLRNIESRTRNLKKEQLRVVDRDGNVVMEKRGDLNSVYFNRDEAYDNIPGNIAIHNHPEGGTFSIADISLMGFGATEMRVAAPEGTYILRNTRYGQRYDGAKQKSWKNMQDDFESASLEFKSGLTVKKQVRAQFSKETAELEELSRKGMNSMRNSGRDSAEFKSIYSEYEKKSAALGAQIEAATRNAYIAQYDSWLKNNSMEYGMEYEFVPTKTRTKKALIEDNAMEDVAKADSGEVVLDRQMHDDIREITDSIMQDILSNAGFARTFSNRNR